LFALALIQDKEPDMWPRAFFTNGHIMVDNQKMSKSAGNFLTVDYCIRQFGADATRLALADAGDSLEDANFASDTVNAGILRLTKEMGWIIEVLQDIADGKLRSGSLEFFDQVMMNDINAAIVATDRAYAGMQMRDVLKYCLYEFSLKRDQYRVASTNDMHRYDLFCLPVLVDSLLPSRCSRSSDFSFFLPVTLCCASSRRSCCCSRPSAPTSASISGPSWASRV
jgi:leucyl-tRNA synthetase